MSETPAPIQKCDRCPEIEALAESYRIALIEAAKLIDFILAPTTTEAERTEIRRRAFGDLSELPPEQQSPSTPSSGTESSKD